jgi:deazaflavin-dependent oxidoreductase (nitroreductase family)
MPKRNDSLQDRLSRYREIKLTVTGRKSGRAISIPVWFVLENENLYLLPVQGSDTQWYRNVLKNPSIRIDARGVEAEFDVVALTDPKRVSPIVEIPRQIRRRRREAVLFEARRRGPRSAAVRLRPQPRQ